MQSLPNWLQVFIAILVLVAGGLVSFVHLQDDVAKNRDAIETVNDNVQKVDDIVRDNQQRLAHIEALLNGTTRNRTHEDSTASK